MDIRKLNLNCRKREKERKLFFKANPIEEKLKLPVQRLCQTVLRDKNIRNLSLDFIK